MRNAAAGLSAVDRPGSAPAPPHGVASRALVAATGPVRDLDVQLRGPPREAGGSGPTGAGSPRNGLRSGWTRERGAGGVKALLKVAGERTTPASEGAGTGPSPATA